MVKVKRRQMGALATNKGKAFGGNRESLNIGDSHEDAEWVIVKKQKVTILIPAAVRVQTRRRVLRTNQVSTKLRKTVHPRSSGGQYKYAFAERSLRAAPYRRRKFASSTLETAPKDSNHLVRESPVQQHSLDFVNNHHSYRVQETTKALTVIGAPKAAKRPSVPQSSHHHGPARFLRPIGCLNVAALQNRMMRASNLERKIAKAGGLSRWLVSLGLGRFVMMFRRRNVDKFQLLNLTMAKLKDMGANAVGPRRKLIHAIDCVSPYCFCTF